MIPRLWRSVFLAACGGVLLAASVRAAEGTDSVGTNAVAEAVPAWRLYDDPSARGDHRWIADFDEHVRLIEEYDGKKRPHNGKRLTIHGAYSIPAPTESGRVVRIRFDSGHLRNARLLFHAGSEQYQVAAEQGSRYFLTAGSVLQSFQRAGVKKGKSPPARRITDDGGLWYAFADGLMDLRYQRGQFIVAMGPRVLMSFPVEAEPTNMILSGEARLNLFQVLNLPPLELEGDNIHTPPEELRPADRMPWRLDGQYRGRHDEDPARLIRHDDGSVELFSESTQSARSAEAAFKSESPVVITLKIHSASAGTGISVPGPNRGFLKFYIGKLDGRNVICREPYEFRELKNPQADLHVLRSPFFCRATYGLDFIHVDFSDDGRIWAAYSRQALHRHHAISPLCVGMLLGGTRHRKKDVSGPEQRIRLSAVDVRPFRLLEGFVDPDILHGTPSDTSDHDWRRACNWALINGWAPAELRQKAVADFLDGALESDMDPGPILQSIRSLVPFMQPPQRHRSNFTPNLMARLERLGDRMLATRQMDPVREWLATWYALGLPEWRRSRANHETSPPALVRSYLHRLCHEERWEELRLLSLEYTLFARPGSRDLLAAWMLDQAMGHLDDVSCEEDFARERYWLHPLRIMADRQTANLLNELTAATRDGEFERACRILINGYDGDSLSVSREDGSLYKPAQVILREFVRSEPELRRVLVEKFSQIGLIRLNRARERGTFDEFEQIAVQFEGTEAARKALAILADRGLSMGQFAMAAERYAAVIPFLTGEERNTMLAKRNLALALSGQQPTEPVTGAVTLPGGTLSAEQYAGLIASALRQSPTADETHRGEHRGGSWPSRETPVLRHVMDLPFFATSQIGARQEGKFLLLQQGGVLHVIDMDQLKTAWSHGSVEQKTEPFSFRPLVLGDRVIAAVSDKQKSAALKCLDLRGGRVVWERAIGDSLAADPFRQGRALFVLALSSDEHLVLQRINPETGEPEFEQFLLRHRHDEKRRNIVRGIAFGRSIAISAAGMLICCDGWGETRWVRRIAFVPPDADPALSAFSHSDDLIERDGRIIVCSPGAPEIVCVDANTGGLLWSKFQPQRKRLLGLSGDTVLMRNTSSVEAINIADGKTRWRSPVDREGISRRLGPSGKVLELRFDSAEPDKETGRRAVRRAALLSATDGEEFGSWEFSHDVLPQSEISAAFTYGGKLLILAGDSEKKRAHKEPSAQLCVLE